MGNVANLFFFFFLAIIGFCLHQHIKLNILSSFSILILATHFVDACLCGGGQHKVTK